MGIYTSCYNFFTARTDSSPAPLLSLGKSGRAGNRSGAEIYDHLDSYYADAARELLLGTPPDDDETLVSYVIPAINRFTTGAYAVRE